MTETNSPDVNANLVDGTGLFSDHTFIDAVWRTELPRLFFGQSAAGTVEVVTNIVGHINLEVHEFEKVDGLDQASMPEQVRRYWKNTLGHAKIAAISGLMRSWLWSEAVLREGLASNALAWASSMRGLIESAGDASHTLMPISGIISEHSSEIRKALTGQSSPPFPLAKLANELLEHFTFADKAAGNESNNLQALRPTDYVKVLKEQGVTRIQEAYASLSGLTHPSAHSIRWMRETRSDMVKVEITKRAQAAAIFKIMSDFEDTFAEVFMSGINPSLCVLKIIRAVGGDERLAIMDDVDLSALPIWSTIAEALEAE